MTVSTVHDISFESCSRLGESPSLWKLTHAADRFFLLSEAEKNSRGKPEVLLRIPKQMRAVIIKLRHAPRYLIIECVICAASQHPSGAGIRWSRINICMGDSYQSMAEQAQAFTFSRNLRAKQHIEFVRMGSALRFVIAAEIGLQPEPVIDVAGERSLKSAGSRKSVTVKQGIADIDVSGAVIVCHSLGPCGGTKSNHRNGEEQLAHSEMIPPEDTGQKAKRMFSDEVTCG